MALYGRETFVKVSQPFPIKGEQCLLYSVKSLGGDILRRTSDAYTTNPQSFLQFEIEDMGASARVDGDEALGFLKMKVEQMGEDRAGKYASGVLFMRSLLREAEVDTTIPISAVNQFVVPRGRNFFFHPLFVEQGAVDNLLIRSGLRGLPVSEMFYQGVADMYLLQRLVDPHHQEALKFNYNRRDVMRERNEAYRARTDGILNVGRDRDSRETRAARSINTALEVANRDVPPQPSVVAEAFARAVEKDWDERKPEDVVLLPSTVNNVAAIMHAGHRSAEEKRTRGKEGKMARKRGLSSQDFR